MFLQIALSMILGRLRAFAPQPSVATKVSINTKTLERTTIPSKDARDSTLNSGLASSIRIALIHRLGISHLESKDIETIFRGSSKKSESAKTTDFNSLVHRGTNISHCSLRHLCSNVVFHAVYTKEMASTRH